MEMARISSCYYLGKVGMVVFAASEAAAILTVERGSLLMAGVGQGGGRV